LAFFIDDENDKDNWQAWTKGSNVATFLGYIDDKQAIRDHVESHNCNNIGNLLELYPVVEKTIPKNIDKKTKFINISGFFNLIHASKKPIAKKIKSWVDDDVLPSLLKTGSYNMQPDKINIKFFYDDAALSDYDKLACMYIAYVGKYKNIYIFKYGLTRNIFSRDFVQHRKSFDQFTIIFPALLWLKKICLTFLFF
jgi:prophage antirepressor-like protein